MAFGQHLISFLKLGWFNRSRMNAYAIIVLIAALPTSVWVFLQALGTDGSDFLAFWSAGRLIVAGAVNSVYSVKANLAVQATLARSDVIAFVSPPPMLLLVAPLGLLSFPVAWLVWVGATFAFWLALSRRFAPELTWPSAAFPGALIAVWHAQTGLLTSGFQAGFATWLQRRPLLAGICVGGLVIKPHLALLIPLALVAGRHWRAFVGAALSVFGLLLLSWLVFGTTAILNYRQSWPVSRYLMETGDAVFFLRQVTVYAAVRVAWSPLAAALCQAIATILVAALTWKAWAGRGSIEGKLALLLSATPLATPYLFSYDLPFLIIPVCWLAQRSALRPGAWDRPLLLFFYLSPLLARALALPLGANLSPWIGFWMLWVVWQRLREEIAEAHRGDPGSLQQPGPPLSAAAVRQTPEHRGHAGSARASGVQTRR